MSAMPLNCGAFLRGRGRFRRRSRPKQRSAMPRNGETAFDHLASAERARTAFAPDESGWSFPDMGVLRLYRREPPSLPPKGFGPGEAGVAEQGGAAACPVAYGARPLLGPRSGRIGHG